MHPLDQRACLREGLYVVEVLFLKDLAVRIAEPLDGRVVGTGDQRWDQHVGTLADLVMQHLRVEDVPLARKRFGPRVDVKIVAIDQRPVDIEQHGLDLHVACVPLMLGAWTSEAVRMFPPSPRWDDQMPHRPLRPNSD